MRREKEGGMRKNEDTDNNIVLSGKTNDRINRVLLILTHNGKKKPSIVCFCSCVFFSTGSGVSAKSN